MPDEAPHPLSLRRFVPLALLVLAGMLFFTLEGHRYLSFTALAEHRERLCEFVAYGGAGAALAFVLAYAGLVALSVPASALVSARCWRRATIPISRCCFSRACCCRSSASPRWRCCRCSTSAGAAKSRPRRIDEGDADPRSVRDRGRQRRARRRGGGGADGRQRRSGRARPDGRRLPELRLQIGRAHV